MNNESESDSLPSIPVVFPSEFSDEDIGRTNLRSLYYIKEPIVVQCGETNADAFEFLFEAGALSSSMIYKIDDIVRFAASIHYELTRPLVLNSSNIAEFHERSREFLEEMLNSAIKFDQCCLGFFLGQSEY